MLVKDGKIIAIGPAKTDRHSLSGDGTSASPLGVQNYDELATSAWVDQHYAKVVPSGDYATKADLEDTSAWAKKTFQPSGDYALKSELPDLTPYLLSSEAAATYWPKACSSDYYKKGETSSKGQIKTAFDNVQTEINDINDRISKLGGYKILEEGEYDPQTYQPTIQDPDERYIYLVKVPNSTAKDSFYEWIWQEDKAPQWQCIGETSLDLSDYVTEDEWNARIPEYAKQSWVSAGYQPKGNYLSANALNGYATQQWVQEQNYATQTDLESKAEEISSWANGKFQEKGNYALADDVNQKFEQTSAGLQQWVEDKGYATQNWVSANFLTEIPEEYVKRNELEEYAKTEEVWTEFSSTSAWANKTFQPSGDYALKSDIPDLEPYATQEWVSDNFLSSAASANFAQKTDLDDYVTKEETTEWDVTPYSGKDGIKVDYETHEISFSGDFVDEHELEDALKPYAFTSAVSGFKNTLVKSSNGTVEVSAYMENGVQVYDLSATQGGDYTQIVGENGVSAEKNEDTGEWHVGMNWDQNLISYGKFYTSPAQEYASSAAFAGYTMVDHISGDPDENDIDLDNDKIIIKKHGLYHVDVLVSVNIDANDTSLNYFTVTLKSGPNETLHQIDASYPHTEYINFSYDINTPTDDYILENTIKDLPVGAEFKIENMNVHRVLYSTGDMYGQGGATYIGGDGITVDQDTINVNIGKGLELNNQTEKKLQVKLGKGLTYGTGDQIDAIVLDDPTEEVVKTVTDLKEELDNKLTTNMNISDAKKIGSMFKNTTYGTMGCSLFTVPLQHKLTTDTQVSFFTTQGLNQQASFPIVVGILEYNFDYWDDDRKQYRSQTNWIADTGPIFNNTPDVNGNTLGAGANKYTFKLNHVTPVVSADYMYGGKKYHNEYGPVLRSDRAYYLAVFAKHPDGLGYVLGDEGYDSPTNSDPYISYYCNNMVYNDGDPTTSGTMDNNWTHWDIDLSISAMNYWNRGGEAKEIVRPFVMIRNPMA